MYSKCNLFIATAFIIAALFVGKALADTNEIKLSFIGDTDSQAFRGVKQGIDEANVQGIFLGQSYSLTTVPNSSTAIFTTANAKHLAHISRTYPNKAIFNLTAEDNELRAKCFTNVLHILPSQAMKKEAEAQWQEKYSGSAAKAQTWHHTFKKYAAGQLNTRFTQSTHHKMTDTAWAGWASVKLLSDSVARNKFNDTTSLLQFIKTELAFDGQKGISLNFRDTGQLRQPLLLIDNGKIAGEAPVRGVVNTTNLDSLGLTHCPK
ncbi:MAG: hypothetical protein ACI9ES_001243 [Oceanospirillaceae bacterium]|jgi:hypothetical protein